MSKSPFASSQNSDTDNPAVARSKVGPPTKHELAVMIWIAVFPTLTVLNLAMGPWLQDLNPVLRTLVLATTAVPIVMYSVMPCLHRVRVLLLRRRVAAV